MKTTNKIPTSKLQRAGNILKTGAKVGVNYVGYGVNKIVNPEEAKAKLDQNNAEDIYDGLKELKGSALKMAQMLSMEKGVLPDAYTDKFQLAQYSVPPLSGALINKTFRKNFGKAPREVFDEFSTEAKNAASIGQVHKAKKDGKDLAVKIQYPGVADSISSDLALVKPFALRMFKLKSKDAEKYFREVEGKLLEETNYKLEVDRSIQISEACAHLPRITFPKYYRELSSDRIITMDWMNGVHLSEFTKSDPVQEKRDQIGQVLWDFYMYQKEALGMVHADPHPGNFLITDDGKLCAIDFGCVKEIPEDFEEHFFSLTRAEILNDEAAFVKCLRGLEIIREDDSEKEMEFFKSMFHQALSLFAEPFQHEEFDFGNPEYYARLLAMGEEMSKNQEVRNFDANRGSKHLLFINRAYYGLYNLLFDLKAKVRTKDFYKYLQSPESEAA